MVAANNVQDYPLQPYSIAMKDGTPFGIAGLWENWKDPASGEWSCFAGRPFTCHNRTKCTAANGIPIRWSWQLPQFSEGGW
jgi:hypothetical protein